MTLSDKPVGVYNVTVELDGYDSSSQIVTLTKDETEAISFTLVQQLGTLQINSTPSGASVYLNGTATGDLTNVTLADKPVGVYNVTVELDGYDSSSQIVTLTKDETEAISFTLVQQLGTLQINSTPSGASVYLNGTATGDLTNVTLSDKPVGVYNVTVELDGYDSSSQIVTLTKDETEAISFTLVQQLGTLQINSTPSGASVYLNGTATGDLTNVTLADKPVGVYNVTVELDSYDSSSQIVTLVKDEPEAVSFALVQQLGTLQINSTPSGASVYLNGTATGDLTNVTFSDKPVGVYNVTVELDGYDSSSQIVTLTKDETEAISFTLVQQLGTLQINSTPSGAIVYLNGTATGDLTNVTLADKPVGVYNVTVELDSYDSSSQIVTLVKDEPEAVSFALVQRLGTLQINSTPSGASVYLNGTATGDLTNVTFSDKPVGVYNVTVELDGYDSSSQIVTLTKDETEAFSFTLVQQLGTLQINSTPSGASVYLNGTATGDLTNVTLSDKPVGVYNVTVELDGYDSASQLVTLAKDETEDVSFTLVEQLGTLQINSTPSGAIVYLNGTATGDLTNVTLSSKPVGVYNVTVELDGYDSFSQIVTLSKDETEDVSFTLVKQVGTLQINSTPSGAIVYLNGSATGDLTNVTLSDKPVGVYNVTVELDGYDSSSRIVTLTKDATEDVSFTLVQQLGTLQINSTPSGAIVYLNGTATGDLTNVTLADKPVGVYNVTVELAGYDSSSQIVTLVKDEPEAVSFALVEQLGTLQINSTPSGASVYLNGTATGELTNVTLSGKPVGVYNVTVLKAGYDSASQTVTLVKDETEAISFTLVQQVGTLQINSTPSGAIVYLNGTATGDLTNVTLSGKPVGVYNVTVELDSYDSSSQIVTVTKDETEAISFTLVQQLGTLQINSTPSGASVYLNGTATGDLTNVTLSDKPVGVYNVTVELDGYDSSSQIVTLTKDATEDVSFTLVQQLGTLQINSTPSGAIVYLNGTATGDLTNVTFSDKPVGVYNVTVELDGYDSASQRVTPAKDETEYVSFTLVEQVGTLQINSTPAGAIVYLNGTATGDLTNVTLSGKPVGVYNVTVLKDGYDSASQHVTLTKDETESVRFVLVEQLGTLQINSTPAGAIVYLNGNATSDLTNVTLADRLVGTYNVTVEKDGYDPASQIVTLLKDETEHVSFTLARHAGAIRVNSTPANAGIWLDGENTGTFTNTTLLTVPIGTHDITMEKSGFVTPVTRSITVEKDEVTDVFFALTQQAGSISVTSSPGEAWIWLDGGNTSVLTNSTLHTIPVGSHEIRLVKSLYYNTTSESVSVSENQTAHLFFTMTPVGSKPVVSFTAAPLSGNAPLEVAFTDTSTGDPQSWNWSFGDGNVSEEQNPVYTYAKEGAYDVSLTAGNPYGTSTVTRKDYCIVSGTSAIWLMAPSGRIPAGDTAGFPVTADGLDNTTELNFSLTFDPALVTVEDVAPAPLVQGADFGKIIDNINGRITVNITDDAGITSGYAAPVAEIIFRATDSIAGLRETVALTITDASAGKGGRECPVVRVDGSIDVEARTAIAAPNGTLPVESSKYLTVSASGLNEVKNVSFIMEFDRTVMSVIDIRANGTVPGLFVSSVIRNENGWLEINAADPGTITGEESIPLVDISVHSNGLPGEREIRLVNLLWSRDNATYSFDDMKPGYIVITPVDSARADNQPVTVENMTFNDDTQEVSINITANPNATITDGNTTILVRNPGIDILIQTSGLENRSSEWTGECTGAEIGNISAFVDLSGDVGTVSTGISANISGSLSALTNPDTGLDITITRGAVNETMGRLFQLGLQDRMGGELEEVAYTMEINKSAFGGITVTDAVIVMSAPELYVNAWGGAENFTILSMAHDGTISLLETSYTYADDIFTFTAISPDGFSFKSLVSFTVNETPLSAFSAAPVAGDAPLSVQFYDYSGGHPDSWVWDFDDGSISTEQNPAHIYTVTGVYDISLTITNVIGADTAEKAGYITVTNPMTVDFSASRNTGSAPLTVTFTDETVGNPDSWLWEFGDGQTSAKCNPVHIYQSAGAFTVSLTATNEYGSVTAEKERFISVSYHRDGGDGDDSTPFVTPTPTPTPVPTTVRPTPTAVLTTNPIPAVINPTEFIKTARLPEGPDGAVERTVIIRAGDMTGYLTIDAGVVARDASGILQENVSIVAVPVTALPSNGQIGAIEHPGALYAFNCTPDGVSFTPAITLTFTLSEEEWDAYGNRAQTAWFNSTSGEWEVLAGVADAGNRTITIQISHFSIYALFADVVPEVPLPDMTKPFAEPSDGPSLWLWGVLIVALVVAGCILISRRQDK